MKKSFLRTWRSKIKKFFKKDHDDFLWNMLTLASLLAVLFMFFLLPRCRQTPPKTVVSVPVMMAQPSPVVQPKKYRPKRKVQAFIASRPEHPVMLAPTATPSIQPTPVPPGGGHRTIVFASNRADGRYYQLYSMDSNGNNVKRLTHTRAYDRDPHFSYDGEKVAFSSNRGGGSYQIYILDLNKSETRQLTSGSGDKTNPIWFPDNSKLFFTYIEKGDMKIMQINADGTDLHQKIETKGCKHLYSISPDGRLLAYEAVNQKYNEIAIYNMETNETKTLMESNDLASYGDPVFSPNGWQLMFSADFMLHRIRELYIFDVVHGTHERMIRDGVDRDDSVFSPDGKLIAYTAKWEDAWNIWVMNADGTNIRNLTQSHYDNVVPTWR